MIKPPVVRILPSVNYRNERILPVRGDIIVRAGEVVQPEMPIAHVALPSPPVNVPVALILGVRPKDMAAYLVRDVGHRVRPGDIIARRKATMLQGKKECASPIDGTIEHVSYDAGQVTIRRPAQPTVISAEAVGKVTGIVPKQAVTIETSAALIQGAFGVGREAYGQLKLLVDRPDGKISSSHLDESCQGCVIAAGGIEDDAVLTRAQAIGVKGLVLGGIKAVGHESWPTSSKAFSLTVVVTDGFGAAGIFPPAFDLLRQNQGKRVWLRAFVAGRPEIVILLTDRTARETPSPPPLATGSRVRMARPPFFGLSGRIIGLPAAPRTLESGMRSLVAEVETDDGRRIVAPLANLELIG